MDWTQVVLAAPVWWLNGLLFVLYWITGHIFEVISILVAAVILFGIDPFLQERASDRPRRYGRGEVHTAPPIAQYMTLGTLAVWMIVSLTSEFPVPLIGMMLWMIGLAGILVVSEERFNQQWWAKIGILAYAGLVTLLRFGLVALRSASPADWAAVVGTSEDAQMVLANTRGNVAMIGIMFTFILYPLGYGGLLLNRFFRNPKPLYNILQESGDVLRRLRTRS